MSETQAQDSQQGFGLYSESPQAGIRWEGRCPDRDFAIELAKRCRDRWGDRWYVVDLETQKVAVDFPA